MFIYTVFSDIETLTCECKFSNCTHTKEPSCAVQKAISEGTLDISGWQSYLKLRNENEYAANGSQYLAAKRAKFKATPHKDRLMALRTPCLHLFRHLAQISLDWRGLPLRGEVSRSDRGADRQTSQTALNLHNPGGGFRLTKNLTSQSARNLCVVLP